MWWIVKRRRRREAIRQVVALLQCAFGAYLPDGRLARAMHADPYVLGYVVARLHGVAFHACDGCGIADELTHVVDGAGQIVFGPRYAALRDTMLCAALMPEDGAYGEGLRVGRAQCAAQFGDWSGADAATAAPAADPLARLAARAAPEPDSRAFKRYFDNRHPA